MAETIKGLNIKLGLDTTELDTKLKSLRSDFKEQQADLKAINTQLKYDPTNVDLWKKKQESLNSTLEITKQKLEAQKEKLAEAKRALEVGSIGQEEFNKIQRSVTYAEADVSKLNDELENTKKKITSLGNANWDNVAKLGSTLTKSLTLPIVGATTALATLSYKALESADKIGDTASKVYLTAEAYQEWQYASEILAVDSDKLFKAFVKVNGMLGDIANGDIDEVNEKLSLIGLTSEDFAGLNTEEAFEKLRDALSECGDEATRTAIANEIFGDKLGSELTQVLSATSEQVEALKDEAVELGIVSNEQAGIAGEVTDNVTKLKQSFSELKTELAMELVPAFNKVIDVLREKVIPKVREVISWWSNLSSSTKKMVVVITGSLAAIGPFLTIVGKVVPLLKSVVTAFTATKGAITIAGTAIKASTLGWVALIAVIAALLLKNEKFRALLRRVIDIVQELLSKIVDLISNVLVKLEPVIEVILGLVDRVIDVIVDLLEKLMGPIQKIINIIIELVEKLTPIIETIVDELSGLIVEVLDVIIDLLDPISDILGLIIDLVVDLVDALSGLIDSILGVLIDIIRSVVDVLKVVIKIVVQVVNLLASILKPILEMLLKLLKPLFKIIGVIIDVISVLFDALEPLLNTLLKPLSLLLDVIAVVLEALEPLLKVICDVLSTVLGPILEVIFELLSPILDVLNFIIDAIKWVVDNIASVFGGVCDETSSFSSSFTGLMGGAVDSVFSKFGRFFSWIKESIGSFASWIGDLVGTISDFFSGVIDGFSNWLNDTVNFVGNWLSDTWNNVCGWFGDVGDSISGWFGDVGDWFADTFNLNGGSNPNVVSNETRNTTNNVTINTSSSEFDVDSINKALGGSYL